MNTKVIAWVALAASTIAIVFSFVAMWACYEHTTRQLNYTINSVVDDVPLLTEQQKKEAKETGFASFSVGGEWYVVHISNLSDEFLEEKK